MSIPNREINWKSSPARAINSFRTCWSSPMPKPRKSRIHWHSRYLRQTSYFATFAFRNLRSYQRHRKCVINNSHWHWHTPETTEVGINPFDILQLPNGEHGSGLSAMHEGVSAGRCKFSLGFCATRQLGSWIHLLIMARMMLPITYKSMLRSNIIKVLSEFLEYLQSDSVCRLPSIFSLSLSRVLATGVT